MKVYVVLSRWDTDSDDGCEVLGVFADPEQARRAMREDAEKLKAEYDKANWQWDARYSEETDDGICLAAGVESRAATIYSWEVLPMDIQ